MLNVGKRTLRIGPVHYVPDLTSRLLSLGQFLRNGFHSRGTASKISLLKGEDKFLTFKPRTTTDTIYVIRSLVEQKEDLHMVYNIDFETMHRRLAHPSKDVLLKAGKYVKDFPSIQIPNEHICPGCAQGKMPNKAFHPSAERASEPFELVHSDLKSFPIDSYHKFQYAIVFYDDYSSYAWTINLRTKDAALPATKQFLAMVEVQYWSTVRKWMSDAGGEYTSKAFINLLKDKGIEILQSVPHAHQQNGRAERIIRTLMEKAETMRLQACLPQSWWEFALNHATHVYNRTPSRRLEWRTPSKWLSGIRPSVEHLRVFGSAAYVFIPAEVCVNKMAPKLELMVYLGNHHGGKGWIFMHSPNNVIFSAAQAIFDESLFPKCPKANIRAYTRLQTLAPPPSSCSKNGNGDCQCPVSGDEEEDKPKVVQQQLAPKQETPTPSRGITPPVRDPSPADQPAPVGPPAHEHPIRERKVPVKPGNVYGDKHPVDIEKSIRRKKDWSCVVGERSSHP